MVQRKRRVSKPTAITSQVARVLTNALTATAFLLAVAFAYYLKTNPTVLTNFATKLQDSAFTKPIGTYILSHTNQTLGAIISLGAAFSVPLAFQAPVAIGGLLFCLEIAVATTPFWEYVGFGFTTLVTIRAPNNKIRVIILALVAILVAYGALSLPSISSPSKRESDPN